MINNVTLVGRLTRDPELRKTGNGKSVVNFTVAVNRQYNKDETDFITCVAWNHTADFMSNYLSKGALVGLTGNIQTGSYEDNESGKTVYTTDVMVNSLQALESKAQREGQEFVQEEPKFDTVQEDKGINISSDDLPF